MEFNRKLSKPIYRIKENMQTLEELSRKLSKSMYWMEENVQILVGNVEKV